MKFLEIQIFVTNSELTNFWLLSICQNFLTDANSTFFIVAKILALEFLQQIFDISDYFQNFVNFKFKLKF